MDSDFTVPELEFLKDPSAYILRAIYSPAETSGRRVLIQEIYAGNQLRWIIDMRSAKAISPVLNSWRPYSKKATIAWWCLKRLRTLYLNLFIMGIRQVIYPLALPNLWTLFPQFIGTWPVILVGSPSLTRKLIVFLCNPSGTIAGIAKIPLSTQAKGSIINEARALSLLSNVGSVPRLLALDKDAGISVQSWVDGKTVDRQFAKEHLTFLLRLPRSTKTTKISDHCQRIINQLQSMPFRSLVELIKDQLEASIDIPTVFEHGDFVPWNLKKNASKEIIAVDWEYSLPDGLPLLDICHFFFRQNYIFQDSSNVWETMMQSPLVGHYCDFLNLTLPETKFLATFYLMRSLTYEIADIHSDESYVKFIERQVHSVLQS